MNPNRHALYLNYQKPNKGRILRAATEATNQVHRSLTKIISEFLIKKAMDKKTPCAERKKEKENNYQGEILHLTKLYFKYEEEIELHTDKQNHSLYCKNGN